MRSWLALVCVAAVAVSMGGPFLVITPDSRYTRTTSIDLPAAEKLEAVWHNIVTSPPSVGWGPLGMHIVTLFSEDMNPTFDTHDDEMPLGQSHAPCAWPAKEGGNRPEDGNLTQHSDVLTRCEV